MPQPHILKITEIFSAIQGEGRRQGEPTLFVRFSGCNLKCSFCDTKYAWNKGREYSISQVLEKIKKLRKSYPAQWVCLTGGEPLLQDVKELVKSLKREKFKVQVETNATVFRPLPVDWYSISPKPNKYYSRPEYKDKAKEVKIVLTENLNFEVIKRIRKKFPEKTPILLQPQSNRKRSMNLGIRLLKEALKADLKNIRLSIQLHKVYGLK
ncbi:MAG: 7-carboxy-7-deazaguanine synthase QueE [Candidatus Aminicenantes bacterium]|nr:MAG: 7-carboxy-7-deazaguanine synthase QueE [Candidatus Aminicenantes bacterium]